MPSTIATLAGQINPYLNALKATALQTYIGKIQDQGGQVYNVGAYGGYSGNGTADDTDAFLAAAAAMTPGGILFIPPSSPKLTGTVTLSVPCTVMGSGVGATTLYKDEGTLDLFVASVPKVAFRDFTVDSRLGAGQHTGGAALRWSSTGGYRAQNVEIAHVYDGIKYDSSQMGQSWIQSAVIVNFVGTGINVVNHAGPFYWRDLWISNDRDWSTTSIGIAIAEAPGGGNVADVQVFSCGDYGILVTPAANKVVSDIMWTSVFADSTFAGHGWEFNNTNTDAYLRRMLLNRCWAATSYLNGIHFVGAAECRLNDCISINNDEHGVYIDANCYRIDIDGGIFSGNSRPAPQGHHGANNYNGIEVVSNTSYFSIRNVKSGAVVDYTIYPANPTVTTDSQKYGINVGGGGDHYWIENNDVEGNATAGINDAGTLYHRRVANNPGYNPVGALGPPAMPATGVAVQNPYGIDCTVYINANGATITSIDVGGSGTGLTGDGAYRVAAIQTIRLNYAGGPPTWQWFGD